ncbi:MAG: glyoxalase [Acidimicrobiales bacterium mtb01]|nr:VOC family protein [Actinomycetota bacterium]TEX45750.1 MAG: glyoxalase [Acidimicrobiales bacterium mtb01]
MEAHGDRRGLVGWSFLQSSSASIDGIHTGEADSVVGYPHPCGVIGVDQVVVMTPSLDRTCGAITAATGLPLKRIRDAGGGVRQGFHRAGSSIIEVVERPDLPADRPADLWGVVLIVNDLEATVASWGPDVVGPSRDAVQPGRRIATVKSDVGLGTAVAIMSPHTTAR